MGGGRVGASTAREGDEHVLVLREIVPRERPQEVSEVDLHTPCLTEADAETTDADLQRFFPDPGRLRRSIS